MSTLGDRLPEITTTPPGPRSRELASRLRSLESPNVTYISGDFPICWREAVGANVSDVDGNVYLDMTGGFGVAATGHRNPRVGDALHDQLDRLVHGMGDVHPPDLKVSLLAALARVAPGDLSRSILASSGAEAVEAALKTARLASGRPGVLCFTGAYHGLTYGALAVSDGARFREPFRDQLGILTLRAPYPKASDPERGSEQAIQAVDASLDGPGGARIGAVLLEPIQGRGGVVIPPAGFLQAIGELCERRGLLLILDEIFTGFGRTGRWFACQHEDVVPDLLCVGKALTGALPFSACIGRPEVMDAWPPNDGEAIHTSTFLGNPLGCAAALAQIDCIEEQGLIERSARLGDVLLNGLADLPERFPFVADVRGRGLLVGIELVRDRESREPDAERARRLIISGLRRGLILLGSGPHGNVISLSPPLTITEEQLEFAISEIRDCLGAG